MNTSNNEGDKNSLILKWLGIDTYKEPVIYIHRESHVRKSEGFEVHARIRVTLREKNILATVNYISSEFLNKNEASLSENAWEMLGAHEGDVIYLSHPKPLQSLSFVRSKVYGNPLTSFEIQRIIEDIAEGRYSNIHIAMFLTACTSNRLNESEIIALTQTMTEIGEQLSWPEPLIVDKHCVGGLPGNRTTLIVVPIVTAFGIMMPKTSSRAITSPAGTADTMETLAPVDLDLKKMQRVVEQELGCIVCGSEIYLSPADDILIRVEQAMDLDSEGQLIASVLSKKKAAGSNHIVIDVPIGPTAKVRTFEMAESLEKLFQAVGKTLGLELTILKTDGSQPIGRGIGPALEAKDVLAVLQNAPDAPQDLRKRALILAGKILEFSPKVKVGEGEKIAAQLLEEGVAWKKFQAICRAQGGLREPPIAAYTHTIISLCRGRISSIHNRHIADVAKLAGAPLDKAAGVVLHTPVGVLVEKGQPLFTIHADSKGALHYAMSLLNQIPAIVQVEACE